MPSLIGSLFGGMASSYGAQVAEEGKAARELALRQALVKDDRAYQDAKDEKAYQRDAPLKNLQLQEAQLKINQLKDPNANQPDSVRALEYRAKQAGLQPGTDDYKTFILNNGDATTNGMKEFSNRIAAAKALGIAETDPAFRSYVLTGKMPREDQQALTSVDKKAILEADDMVSNNQAAVDALTNAEKLSPSANSGMFASQRAWLGNNLPDYAVPDFVSSPKSSQDTANFDNQVIGNAVTQLKAIFGAAPTEGERQILLDLQGSSSQPVGVRKEILGRAKEMAQRRLDFNQKRADDLRGNNYYRPKDGSSDPQSPAQSQPMTSPQVDDLVKKYGGQ